MEGLINEEVAMFIDEVRKELQNLDFLVNSLLIVVSIPFDNYSKQISTC